MNIKEYLEAASTTQRGGSSITHRVRFDARNGYHFHARFSRKWQLMYLDTPHTRFEPVWLSRYNGTRNWEPLIAQWWRDNGGIGSTMFSLNACDSPTSEIMSAVTRYGHVMIATKESSEPAYISCLDGKSGVVSNAPWGLLASFGTLRELRGWLSDNVSYVAKSTRSKMCNTLGEWLASIADTEILPVNMCDQEVPMYLRNSDIEEMTGFPDWKYDGDDGNLKQNIERIAALSAKKLEYGFNRQLETMLSSRIGRRTVRLDVTRKLAWTRGAYGDERSCFWTSATQSRNMLQHAGAYALRFYNPDGTGVGRCWALPRGDAIAIFNAYGRYQLHEIAAILEHVTGHEAQKLQYNYANIYINGESAYGFNYPNRHAQFNADLNNSAPRLYNEVRYCRNCNALLNPTGAEDIPDDRRCPSCHENFEQRRREEEEELARHEAARIERMAQQATRTAQAIGNFGEALGRINLEGVERARPTFNIEWQPGPDMTVREVYEAREARERARIAIAQRAAEQAEQYVIGQENPIPVPILAQEDVVIENDANEQLQVLGGRLRDVTYHQMCIDACWLAAIEHPGRIYTVNDLRTFRLDGDGVDIFITATRDFWNAWFEMPAHHSTGAFTLLVSAEPEMSMFMDNTIFRFERRPVEFALPREATVTLTQVWVLVNRRPIQ